MEDIEFLRGTVGEDDLSQVTDLEVIFSDTSKFEKFEELTNIRRLTLIDTKMRRIVNMKCIGMTLQSLTLTKQNLERMENLAMLPNLTELFLHRNNIQKIENLAGCPKLRRLWLSENKIQSIEGLENLGDLREFCIQGNRISKLTGLESNTYLRILDVSRNNVTKLQELEELSHLSNLRELNLQNDTFGACPVVYQESYRSFAICVLKQIRFLDGEVVKDIDRSEAEDDFLQKALEFNDKVEDLHRMHRDELRTIEMSRLKSIREAEELKAELIAQFSKLQEVVSAGREKVRREQTRQCKLREQNLNHLKGQLAQLRKQHRDILEDLLEEEKRNLEQEEKAFAHLSRRARLELNESVAMAEMSHGVSASEPQQPDDDGDDSTKIIKRVVFQVLLNSTIAAGTLSSELKALALCVRDSQRHEGEPLKIYRAAKVFNADLHQTHMKASSKASKAMGCDPFVVQVYIGIRDLAALKRALTHGLEHLLDEGQDALVFTTDPKTAVRLYGSASDFHGMYRVLQCRAVLPQTFAVKGASDSLVDLNTAAGFIKTLPSDSSAAKVECSLQNGLETFYVVRPSKAALILPTVYLILSDGREVGIANTNSKGNELLAQEPGLEQVVSTINERIHHNKNGIPAAVEGKLTRIEGKIDTYVSQYIQRVQQELDPDTANEIETLEGQVNSMEATLLDVRKQIDDEKGKQEQILREFHSGAAAGGGGQGNSHPAIPMHMS